jgi:hypothetical protein
MSYLFRPRFYETPEPIEELAQYNVEDKCSARMARLRKKVGAKALLRVSEYILVWLARQHMKDEPAHFYEMNYEAVWSSQSEIFAVLSEFQELQRFFVIGEHFISFDTTVTDEEKNCLSSLKDRVCIKQRDCHLYLSYGY